PLVRYCSSTCSISSVLRRRAMPLVSAAEPGVSRRVRQTLTLKLHAQPGLCLHHNHQHQIPWTNPALPLGKPLPPLNPTSLATKTEQRRSHPHRRHRHRKRIGHFRPNSCLEPSTLDRTRLPSALRSPV